MTALVIAAGPEVVQVEEMHVALLPDGSILMTGVTDAGEIRRGRISLAAYARQWSEGAVILAAARPTLPVGNGGAAPLGDPDG